MRNKIGNYLKSTETMDSTLTQHAIKSGAAWLASADAQTRDRFLNELSEGELLALPYLFEFWAHPHQLPPDGDWRSWVILGGRGAGKTRAGAEWVRAQVEGARPLTNGQNASPQTQKPWIRRGRIDGDTWEGVDISLGEESEQYRLRVLRDGQGHGIHNDIPSGRHIKCANHNA